MGKKDKLLIAGSAIFLVVFNFIFLLTAGTDHPMSVWISYIFIHVAYLMILVAPLLTRKTKHTELLRMPLILVSKVHFGITFVVGLLFILLCLENFKVNLIIHVVITAAYLVVLIFNIIANEHTVQSNERHEQEMEYVRGSADQLKGIMDSVSDSKLRKKVERIYDLVSTSPVRSDASVRSVEWNVMNLIGELRESIQEGNTEAAESLLRDIENAANERNRRLKRVN